ncbi:MAG: threonine synthase [Acidobacteriota bacterium]
MSRLECGMCGRYHDARVLQRLCTACGRPLLARYDLAAVGQTTSKDRIATRRSDMWRYAEVLPAAGSPVSLGEGWTPLVPAPALASDLGVGSLRIKDESLNPTGSFKARGLSAAVTAAKERGVARVALPTAGNAGMALAAYAAAAGLAADVYCPADTPRPFVLGARQLGAAVHLVDGLITDCGRAMHEDLGATGWFDLSTLKEPYRVEGKKTMGYEIAEQCGWKLPDVILYPTGGGTGLVGMWKAFSEMEELGWIDARRPRMVSVQAAGCAPMVRAFAAGDETARPWEGASTVASGLRVPAAVGDFLILEALRASGGTAVAVEDATMVAAAAELGSRAGVLASPEGGACLAGLRSLVESGKVVATDDVVLFNTGTALTYLDAMDAAR